MGQTKQLPFFYQLILYVCGFFLFLEWLYPLHFLGTSDHFFVFLLFTQFCFLITILQLHWTIGNGIKAVAFIFIIHGLFFSTSLFDIDWIFLLFEDIQLNIGYLFSRDFHMLTGLFRTFLFLLLIWLMSYLIYYWFVTAKKVLVFSLCTFVYIGMLDTFSFYDGDWAIVRTFFIVAITYGLTNVMKDAESTNTIHMFRRNYWKWMVPIFVFSLLAVSVGLLSPKTAGEWRDPFGYITEYFGDNKESDGNGGSGATRKVGYGENDEQLGGSFEFDDTPIFHVNSSEKRYWRVESKEIYTGKGWVAEERGDQWTYSSGDVPFTNQANQVDYQREEATITFESSKEMNKLVYPYGAKRVETDESVQQYLVHLTKGTIQPTIDNEVTPIQSYTLKYHFPIFQEHQLQNIQESTNNALHESYTQLPDELPERIGELAEEITAEHDTQFDKVKAVEQYFSQGDYIYEIDDVSIPYEDIDYVDEFLFETQAGYCDNFSTSMAVMLRTLNIPTRWVKGFTGGTLLDEAGAGDGYVYEITNSNAHSWVEVYFSGIGWVPFEPTIGFSGASEIEQEGADEPTEEENESVDDRLEQDDVEEDEDTPEEELNDEEDNIASAGKKDETSSTFPKYILVGLLIVGVFILYFWRYKIIMYIILSTLHEGQKAKSIDRSLRFCLYVFRKKGLHKETGETLRSFASRVDKAYGMNDMSTLIQMYDQYMYSKEQQIDIHVYKETWKKVIHRALLDR